MRKRTDRIIKKIYIAVFLICLLLTGCAKKEKADDGEEKADSTTIVLSKGMAEDELFRIENLSCKVPEYMVYLTNIQKSYEKIYGSSIWDQKNGDSTLADELKDIALARISRVKTMNLIAERSGLVENDDIIALATDLSAAYYGSLSPKEISTLNIDQGMLTQMYVEYIIADALYDKIIQDVNPEISDDEARAVVVEQICIYKGEENEKGEFVPFDSKKQKECYEKIRQASQKLEGEEAEDFESVSASYNQAEEMTISFVRGEVDPAVEKTAYSLAENEVSDIIETSESYMIIKCMSMGNQEQTEANKKKIIEKRRQEAFTSEYDDFTQNLTKKMNDKAWEKIDIIRDEEITTDSFFTLYEENEPEALWTEESVEETVKE